MMKAVKTSRYKVLKQALEAALAGAGETARQDERSAHAVLRDLTMRALQREGFSIGPDKMTPGALKRYGFSASTIIDVGVNKGTPWLYAAFPAACFLLVDPRKESEQAIEKFKDRYSIVFSVCALGAEVGEAVLHIPLGSDGRSSIYERNALSKRSGERFEERKVKVVTLDSLLARQAEMTGSVGLKIDTEGYEMEVLKGASNTLRRAEFVICETSLKRRFTGSYVAADLMAFMAQAGFTLLDVMSGSHLSPKFVDCLFVKKDDARLGA